MTETRSGDDGASTRLLVVIVNYKTAPLTIACLRALQSEIEDFPKFQVTVVDNASGDGPALSEAIKSHGWERFVTLVTSQQNGGFAAGNNIAIQSALSSAEPPDLFLLLNSDTEVRRGALRTIVEFMEARPEVGIAGTGIENPDGSDWPIAFRFITPANQLVDSLRLGLINRLLPGCVVARQMDQDQPAAADWVAGASMIIRRQVFNSIGLLDDGYFLYFEEVDFCLRARRAGWPCWYVPKSRVMHIGGESSGLSGISGKSHGTESDVKLSRVPAYWFESRRRFFMKNFGLGGTIAADVAFGLGYTLWRIRRFFQHKPDVDPPHMLADFLRHSVLFGRHKSINSPPRPPSSPTLPRSP